MIKNALTTTKLPFIANLVLVSIRSSVRLAFLMRETVFLIFFFTEKNSPVELHVAIKFAIYTQWPLPLRVAWMRCQIHTLRWFYRIFWHISFPFVCIILFDFILNAKFSGTNTHTHWRRQNKSKITNRFDICRHNTKHIEWKEAHWTTDEFITRHQCGLPHTNSILERKYSTFEWTQKKKSKSE